MTNLPFDLSVVIVPYRVRDLLRDCLQSLFAGGGLNGLQADVIVVDNASGDGTAEMVRTEFPQVRLIAGAENKGFSRANNEGLALATGRNLLLLNPDTVIPVDTLARCVAYLDAQPESVGAMTCRVLSPDGSLQWACSRRAITPWSECCRALLLDRLFPRSPLFNPEPDVRWDRREARNVEAILGAFMLIRRPAWEQVGGLDEQFFLMYEDMDWCYRARQAGYVLRFWPDAHLVHLGGQSWRQEPVETFANSHASALQYFAKHYPRSLGVVRGVSRVGMELKIGLLRLNLLRRPNDAYTIQHLQMARAARRALRTGAGPGPVALTPEVAGMGGT